MGQTIYQADSFTSEPFKGNPAGVCILESPADEAWMQHVATEMALSETAFVIPTGNDFHLRWFTPVAEVDLCGHATLATAHILVETGTVAQGKTIRFHTASGQLLTTVEADGLIEMDFPAESPSDVQADESVRMAVDVPIINVARNRMDCLVEVESQQHLIDFIPDGSKISMIDARGLILTARSADPAIDFVSRFFAPRLGILEDPVTGSAHCCLGPYWSAKLSKSKLKAEQLSSRSGQIGVEVLGERVLLSGRAVTTMVVELLV